MMNAAIRVLTLVFSLLLTATAVLGQTLENSWDAKITAPSYWGGLTRDQSFWHNGGRWLTVNTDAADGSTIQFDNRSFSSFTVDRRGFVYMGSHRPDATPWAGILAKDFPQFPVIAPGGDALEYSPFRIEIHFQDEKQATIPLDTGNMMGVIGRQLQAGDTIFVSAPNTTGNGYPDILYLRISKMGAVPSGPDDQMGGNLNDLINRSIPQVDSGVYAYVLPPLEGNDYALSLGEVGYRFMLGSQVWNEKRGSSEFLASLVFDPTIALQFASSSKVLPASLLKFRKMPARQYMPKDVPHWVIEFDRYYSNKKPLDFQVVLFEDGAVFFNYSTKETQSAEDYQGCASGTAGIYENPLSVLFFQLGDVFSNDRGQAKDAVLFGNGKLRDGWVFKPFGATGRDPDACHLTSLEQVDNQPILHATMQPSNWVQEKQENSCRLYGDDMVAWGGVIGGDYSRDNFILKSYASMDLDFRLIDARITRPDFYLWFFNETPNSPPSSVFIPALQSLVPTSADGSWHSIHLDSVTFQDAIRNGLTSDLLGNEMRLPALKYNAVALDGQAYTNSVDFYIRKAVLRGRQPSSVYASKVSPFKICGTIRAALPPGSSNTSIAVRSRLELSDPYGTYLQGTITDAHGGYCFEQLGQGIYSIRPIPTNPAQSTTFEPTEGLVRVDGSSLVKTVDFTINFAPPHVTSLPPFVKTEDDPSVPLNLDPYVVDDFFGDEALSWELLPGQTLPIPVTVDATNRRLIVHSAGTDYFGRFQVKLAVRNPAGIASEMLLRYEFTSDNDPPELLPVEKTWNVVAEQFLKVDLHAVTTDVDHPLSELTWTASTTTPGSKISIDQSSGELTLVPPAGFVGELDLSIDVVDPLLGKHSRIYAVDVRSPGLRIDEKSFEQALGLGSMRGEFRTTYAKNDPTLEKARIYILSSRPTGTVDVTKLDWVAGTILPIQPENGEIGSPWDGRNYAFEIAANSEVKTPAGASRGELRKIWTGGKPLVVLLVLSDDGIARQELFGPAATDFDGLIAHPLSGIVSYLDEDADRRQPRIDLSWSYAAGERPSTQVLTWKALDQQQSASEILDPASRTYQINGLQDDHVYEVRLISTDAHGNSGAAKTLVLAPSGNYRVTVSLNDHQLPMATGRMRLALNGTVLREIALSPDNAGIYTFDGLLNAAGYEWTLEADRYGATPFSRKFSISHADQSISSILATRETLKPGAALVAQEVGTGDLLFRFAPDLVLPGEAPSHLNLRWESLDPKLPVSQFEIPVTSFSADLIGGKTVWNIRIPRHRVEAEILPVKPDFANSIRYLSSELITSYHGETFHYDRYRTSTWNYPVSRDAVRLAAPQSFATPPKPRFKISRQGVGDETDPQNDSRALFDLLINTKQLLHDPIIHVRVCQVNDPANCQERTEGRAYPPIWGTKDWRVSVLDSRLAKELTSAGGVGVLTAGDDVASEFGAALSVSGGSSEAGASWMVNRPVAGKPVGVWILQLPKAVAPGQSASASYPLSVAVDGVVISSSMTAVVPSTGRWVKLGTFVPSDTGLTELRLMADTTLRFRSVALRLCESRNCGDITSDLSNPKPIGSAGSLTSSWVNYEPGTAYRVQVWTVDRYGNRSPMAERVFETLSANLLSSVTVTQLDESGDLRLELPGTAIGSTQNPYKLTFGGKFFPIQEVIDVDGFTRSAGMLDVRVKSKDIPTRLRAQDSWFSYRSRWRSPMLLTREVVPDTLSVCKDWPSSLKLSFKDLCEEKIQSLELTEAFAFRWPAMQAHASAQEFRAATQPQIGLLRSKPDSLVLSVSGLNPAIGEASREQLSGQVRFIFEPGANCAPSSQVAVSYGNRFEPGADGWLYFQPTFAAGLASQSGDDILAERRHQWLDRPDGGGAFLPSNEVSLSTVTPGKSPSVSMGIRLTEAQAAKRWAMWLLPLSTNTEKSQSLFYGLNGAPLSKDVGTEWGLVNGLRQNAWVRASQALQFKKGDNTLDLYMAQSGTGIRGIALRPVDGNGEPDAAATFAKFGTGAGFSTEMPIGGLFSDRDIQFKIVTVDRKGNASDTIRQTFHTPAATQRLPRVTFQPITAMTDGFVHADPAVFGLQLDLTGAVAAPPITGIEVALDRFDGSSTPIVRPLVALQDATTGAWSVSIDGMEDGFPSHIDETHGYALRARAVDGSNRGEWSRILFGVRTGDPMPSLSIEDPIYMVGNISMNFVNGYKDPSDPRPEAFIADFELDNLPLMEGTRVYMRHTKALLVPSATQGNTWQRVASVQDGFLEVKRCDEENCEIADEFAIQYGKFAMILPVRSMKFSYGFAQIVFQKAELLDSREHRTGTSEVKIDARGVIDGFSVAQDRFYVQDVIGHGEGASFSMDACVATFSHQDQAGSDRLFRMDLKGCSDEGASYRGPFLDYQVFNPDGNMAFSAYDPLANAVSLEYRIQDDNYAIVAGIPNAVTLEKPRNILYDNWPISIRSFRLEADGVHITNADLELSPHIFSANANGKMPSLNGLSGMFIAQDPNSPDGLLQLQGEGTLPVSNGLSLAHGWSLQNLGNLRFHQLEDYGWVVERGGQNGEVRIPNSANSIFRHREDPLADATGSSAGTNFVNWMARVMGAGDPSPQNPDNILPLSALIIRPGTLAAFEAGEAKKIRSVGRIEVHGALKATYAGDDFDIELLEPEIWFGKGYFRLPFGRRQTGSGFELGECSPFQVSEAEIKLRPDLSLRFIAGRALMRGGDADQLRELVPTIPKIQLKNVPFSPIAFSGPAISLVNGENDIHTLLEMPEARLRLINSDKTPLGSPNVGIWEGYFDSWGGIVGASGGIDLNPSENKMSVPGFGGLGSLALDRLYFGVHVKNEERHYWFGSNGILEFGPWLGGFSGEKIEIEKLKVDMNQDLSLELDTLQTSAFGVARTFSIAPRDLIPSLRLADQKWLEISTSGDPIQFWFHRDGDAKPHLQINNWALKFTDAFPVTALRNFYLGLDVLKLSFGNGGSRPGIALEDLQLTGSATYEELRLFGPYLALLPSDGKKVELSVQGTKESTRIKIVADKIRIGESKVLELSQCPDANGSVGSASNERASATMTLAGDFDANLCVKSGEIIPIYPIGSKDPDVWIESDGRVALKFGSGGVDIDGSFQVKSKEYDIAGNRIALDVKANKVRLHIDADGIALRELDVSQPLGGMSTSFGPVVLGLNRMYAVKASNSDEFVFGVEPYAYFNGGGVCHDLNNASMWSSFQSRTDVNDLSILRSAPKGSGKIIFDGGIEFRQKLSDNGAVAFNWHLGASLSCDIASLPIYVKDLRIDQERASVQGLIVDVGSVLKTEMGSLPIAANTDLWIHGRGSYWNRTGGGDLGTWEYHGAADQKFSLDVLGARVEGTIDVLDIFKSNPGVTLDNLKVRLPAALGGSTITTNMIVKINGVSPYVHPRGNLKELPMSVPAIQLTDNLSFTGARMVLRYEPAQSTENANQSQNAMATTQALSSNPEASAATNAPAAASGANARAEKPASWIFEGNAKFALPGFADGMEVELAMSRKPIIRKAVLTLTMNPGRIAIGATGLYMTKLMGAYYDGDEQPKGAAECCIPALPYGKKLEMAVWIEAAEPKLMNGMAGFWVQLNHLNFGANGKLELMSGLADGDACAALYNSGRNFHGQFRITLSTPLAVRGKFIIDIWTDRLGKNLAGETTAQVGLKRGAIIRSRWFKYPRRTNWMGAWSTKFGRFKNGSNGFTTGVRALGKTWGAGFIGSSFKLGNVGKYKLASPTTGASSQLNLDDPSKYNVYNLGFGLEEGIGLSFVVASSNDAEWNGRDLFLTEGSQLSNFNGPSGLPSNVVTALSAVENDSSLNVHTLVYRSAWGSPILGSLDNRLYFWVPSRADGDPPPDDVSDEDEESDGEGEDAAAPAAKAASASSDDTQYGSLSKKGDDYLLFASLLPAKPQNDLRIGRCPDWNYDPNSYCINGTIQGFQRTARSFPSSAGNGSSTQPLLMKQRMRLQLAIQEKRASSPGQTAFTGGTRILPLTEFDGASSIATQIEADAAGVSDLACATYNATTHTLELKNCKWQGAGWREGTFGMKALIEMVDFLSPMEDGSGQMQEVSESDATVYVDASADVLDPNTDRPAEFSLVASTALIKKPTDFSATGSTWNPGPNGKDERRRIILDWTSNPEAPIGGWLVRWRGVIGGQTSENAWHSAFVGVENHWEWDAPVRDAYLLDTPCPTPNPDPNAPPREPAEQKAMMCLNPGEPAAFDTYQFADDFQVSLTPLRGREVVETDADGSIRYLDPEHTIPSMRIVYDTIWSESLWTSVKVGNRSSMIAGQNKLSLSNPAYSGTTPAPEIRVARNEPIEVPLTLTALPHSLEIPQGRQGAPDHFAELQVNLLGADLKPLDPTQNRYTLGMPAIGLDRNRLYLGQSRNALKLSFMARNKAVKCSELFNPRPEHGGDASDDVEPCFGDGAEDRQLPTPMESFKVQVTAFTQGSRGDINSQATVIIPVKVIPPRMTIRKVLTQYLLAGRVQDLRLEVTGVPATLGFTSTLKLMSANGSQLTELQSIQLAQPKRPANFGLWWFQKDPVTGWRIADTGDVKRVVEVTGNESALPNEVLAMVVVQGPNSTDTSISNIVRIPMKRQPYWAECNDETLEYQGITMEPIGFFPKKSLPQNGLMRFIFSEAHHPNRLPWSVRYCRTTGSTCEPTSVIDVQESMITEEGLEIPVPSTVQVGEHVIWEVSLDPAKASEEFKEYESNIASTCMKDWRSRPIAIAPPRSLSIKLDAARQPGKFLLEGMQAGDKVKYRLGYDQLIDLQYQPNVAYPGAGIWVSLPRTDWVVASSVTSMDLNPLTARAVVKVPASIAIKKESGDNSENLGIDGARISVAPGTRLLLSHDVPAPQALTDSRAELWCRLGPGKAFNCDHGVVIDENSISPLSVEIRHLLQPSDPSRTFDTIIGSSRSFRFIAGPPEGTVVIPIQIKAARLAAVLKGTLEYYPLLVRLDASFPAWSSLAQGVSFHTDRGWTLEADVETFDPAKQKLEAWVRIPKVLLDRDLVLQVWAGPQFGSPSQPQSKDVWSMTDGAWHLATPQDAAGKSGDVAPFTVTSGKIGSGAGIDQVLKAVDLDKVTFAQDGGLKGVSADVTLSAWVRIPELSAIPPTGIEMLGRGDAEKFGASLRIDPTGSVIFRFAGQILQTQPRVVAPGEWAYVAGRYGRSDAGTASILVNGIQHASADYGTVNTQFLQGGDIRFGQGALALDEPRIASRDLGEDWLRLDWETQRSRPSIWRLESDPQPTSLRAEVLEGVAKSRYVAVIGDEPFVDRETRVVALPPSLLGAVWIRPAAGKQADASEAALRIQLSRAARVALLVRSGHEPRFLQALGFTPSGEAVALDDGSQLAVYFKNVPAGVFVAPGASFQDASALAHAYSLLIHPLDGDAGQVGEPGRGWVSTDGSEPIASGGVSAGTQLPEGLVESSPIDVDGVIVRGGQDGSTIHIGVPTDAVVISKDPEPRNGCRRYGTPLGIRNMAGDLESWWVFSCPVDRGGDLQLQPGEIAVIDQSGKTPTGTRLDGAQSIEGGAGIGTSLTGEPGGPVVAGPGLVPPARWRLVPQVPSSPVVIHLERRAEVTIWVHVDNLTLIQGLSSNGFQRGSEQVALSDGRYLVPMRRAAEAGDIAIPDGVIYPYGTVPGECLVSIVAIPRPWQGYQAKDLKLHVVGGGREATSSSWKLADLDVEFLAGEPLSSWTHRMRLRSASGILPTAQQAVLSLGTEQVYRSIKPDGQTLEYVVSRTQRLSDLSIEAVDDDSVWVDAVDFSVRGTVGVRLRNRGQEALERRFEVVLFVDRNNNWLWDPGIDDQLATGFSEPIAAGRDTTLFFQPQGSIHFPDNALVAFADPVSQLADADRRNNVNSTWTACRRWQSTIHWDPTAEQRMRSSYPWMAPQVPFGAPVAGVRLRDTDGDGLWSEADSLLPADWQNGEWTIHKADGSTLAKVRSQDALRLDDFDGDGRIEIAAGDRVYSQTGNLLWSLEPSDGILPSRRIDADGDGWFDEARLDGSCARVYSRKDGRVTWTSSRCTDGAYRALSAIAGDHVSCADVSVAALMRGPQGVPVRVGNAGTVQIPAGLPLAVQRNGSDGTQESWTVRTSRALSPGEWEDVDLSAGRWGLNLNELSVQSLPGELHLVDRDPVNDRIAPPRSQP